MGLDITVLVVDWDHLARTPAAERLGMLEDAAYPDDDCDDRDSGGGGTEAPVEHGWVRRPDTPWCALYEFFRTLGSFKPHFWAGQAWEDVRDFAEPDLRAALDAFLAGLFWLGPDDAAADTSAEDEPAAGLFPCEPDPWRPRLLVVRTPEQVTDLARAWAVVAPLLEDLRAPYAVHAERPGRWIANFEEFAMLVRDWGEVVTAASRSGRGLIGLPI
ncbi:hypothetical protein ACFC18_11170 [Streptomyces sp. NPDC056121]|uniref:hypothetical protein n=1 Tax=unclassified Streptomyces TaxID=2593676 RepID=UPI00224FF287|nr:hypothetical protein [Streptomyces sp. NBC_00401]MCX5084810.1 hypothetical protein [Streptomyces sp. NBC_00401]